MDTYISHGAGSVGREHVVGWRGSQHCQLALAWGALPVGHELKMQLHTTLNILTKILKYLQGKDVAITPYTNGRLQFRSFLIFWSIYGQKFRKHLTTNL